ncbi:MAG: LysE family transporter [Pseudomonadota bacterium]
MLSLSLAVLLLLGTPGPGVLTLAGVGAAFGRRHGLTFFTGLWSGHNLVCVLVVLGLAAVLLAASVLRIALAILSTLYLLWLAVKIALAGTEFDFIQKSNPPGFCGGLLLQAINPKAYAVSTLVFANFPLGFANLSVELAIKFLIFNVVWVISHGTWLLMGVSVRRLGLNAANQRRINLALAVSLVIVVLIAGYHLVTEAHTGLVEPA